MLALSCSARASGLKAQYMQLLQVLSRKTKVTVLVYLKDTTSVLASAGIRFSICDA